MMNDSIEHSAPILEGEDLHKTYRMGRVTPRPNGASISIAEGEWVAVLGASGSRAPKLHLLGGLDRPDEGRGVIRTATNQSISRAGRPPTTTEPTIGSSASSTTLPA